MRGELRGHVAAQRERPGACRVLEQRLAVALHPVPASHEAGYVPVGLADPVSEWVGVPISAGGTLLGALSLSARPSGTLRGGTLAAARAIAAQAGVALQNTRLLLALSEGKREWEGTVDAIGDGICVLDARGTIRRANRAFCALAAVPVTAVAGRSWISLVPPAWAETFQWVIDEPGGTIASGSCAPVNGCSTCPLHLTDAGMASVVLVVSDQTEKRRRAHTET